MKPINQKIMNQFVSKAIQRLVGDWVLLGGSVLPLLGKEVRVTLDIDLAGPKTATQSETLILMDLAEELGLPPEAINTAGAFFLHRIPFWKDHLVLIGEGKNGNLYRPDLWLFIRLKIARLSESDLSDCLILLNESPSLAAKDREELMRELKKGLRKEGTDPGKLQRRQTLLQALSKKKKT